MQYWDLIEEAPRSDRQLKAPLALLPPPKEHGRSFIRTLLKKIAKQCCSLVRKGDPASVRAAFVVPGDCSDVNGLTSRISAKRQSDSLFFCEDSQSQHITLENASAKRRRFAASRGCYKPAVDIYYRNNVAAYGSHRSFSFRTTSYYEELSKASKTPSVVFADSVSSQSATTVSMDGVHRKNNKDMPSSFSFAFEPSSLVELLHSPAEHGAPLTKAHREFRSRMAQTYDRKFNNVDQQSRRNMSVKRR